MFQTNDALVKSFSILGENFKILQEGVLQIVPGGEMIYHLSSAACTFKRFRAMLAKIHERTIFLNDFEMIPHPGFSAGFLGGHYGGLHSLLGETAGVLFEEKKAKSRSFNRFSTWPMIGQGNFKRSKPGSTKAF